MIIRATVIIILFLSFRQGFSQDDLRKGFIITQEGDTITGYVLYKENDSRFRSCLFQKDLNSEPTTYDPTQLFGYGFQSDRLYISKEITIDSVKGTYFTEVLVQGKASLLLIYRKFFLVDSENSIFELYKTESEIVNEKGRFMRTNNMFIGILNWKFSDCNKINKRAIETTRLEEKSLTKIFELYNSCFSIQQKSFKSAKAWTRIFVGLSGGFAHTTLNKLESTYFYDNIDEDQFEKDLGLFGGISFIFMSPRISERLNLNVDLFYQQISHESLIANPSSYETIFLEYNSLQIPVSFSYVFNNSRRKIKPSFEIGLNFNYVINSTSYWQYEQVTTTTVLTDRIYDAIVTKKVFMAPFIGVSAFKELSDRARVFLKFRYQYGFSVIENGVYVIPQQRISLSTGILFTVTK